MKTILLRNRLVLCAAVIWTFLACPALFSQEEVTRSQLSARPAGEPRIIWNRESSQAVLTNGRLQISLMCQDRHGAEESRFQQRRSFSDHVEPEAIMGRCDTSFLRQVQIADDPVGPQVDHVDLEHVARGFNNIRDLHPPGSSPENAKIFPIQPHFRNVSGSSKIKKQLP